jgi:hypothetical protein
VRTVRAQVRERCDSGAFTATALRVLRFCNCGHCHSASGTALRRERCESSAARGAIVTATALGVLRFCNCGHCHGAGARLREPWSHARLATPKVPEAATGVLWTPYVRPCITVPQVSRTVELPVTLLVSKRSAPGIFREPFAASLQTSTTPESHFRATNTLRGR